MVSTVRINKIKTDNFIDISSTQIYFTNINYGYLEKCKVLSRKYMQVGKIELKLQKIWSALKWNKILAIGSSKPLVINIRTINSVGIFKIGKSNHQILGLNR
jgi:hypothetical protein